MNAYCMNCIISRQLENIKDFEDEALKADYMKEVMRIIIQADNDTRTPELFELIDELYMKYFGAQYDYKSLKDKYNTLMLEKEDYIWSRIINSEDSLKEALKYSQAGNYIDFASGNLDDDKIDRFIERVRYEDVDDNIYRQLIKDLDNARRLIFIADNCGEIVLDKLFIRCIKDKYPSLHISVLVRGKMVINDATMYDADMVGLTKLVDVIDSGTGIPGTILRKISPRAGEYIKAADLIISKGQGNFESLNGCGLNIYYIFLCKCDWFTRLFGMERFKGVFTNEHILFSETRL